MKYKIVQMVRRTDDTEVMTMKPFESLDALKAWLAVSGFAITGESRNPRHRAELQGQPIIKGFLGPMWDGDAVRYEDRGANDILST